MWFLMISGAILLTIANLPTKRIVKELPYVPVTSHSDDLPELNSLYLNFPQALKLNEKETAWVEISGKTEESKDDDTAQEVESGYFLRMRLEMDPIVHVDPAGEIRHSLQSGKSIRQRWQLQSSSEGEWHGTLWVYLDQVDKTSKVVLSETLYAIPQTITVTSIFGLQHRYLRWLGSGLVLISLLLAIQYLIDLMEVRSRLKNSKKG